MVINRAWKVFGGRPQLSQIPPMNNIRADRRIRNYISFIRINPMKEGTKMFKVTRERSD